MILTLEALAPFSFKTSGAIRTIKPGERFHLPEDKAQKLIKLAEGKVRVVVQGIELRPAMWVEFNSPLFDTCTAQVEAIETGQVWIGQHSVLRQPEPVRIPTGWIRGVYRNSQPAQCAQDYK